MMNRKIMHCIDAFAVAMGSLLIAVGIVGIDMAQAAGLNGSISTPASQPVLLLMGATLATFPATRRVLWPALFSHHDLVECQDVTDAVCRVGLQQRVQAANLYMTDLSDDAVNRAFGSEEALLDWFGPAYADAKLRSQMSPEIVARIESLAHKTGRQLS